MDCGADARSVEGARSAITAPGGSYGHRGSAHASSSHHRVAAPARPSLRQIRATRPAVVVNQSDMVDGCTDLLPAVDQSSGLRPVPLRAASIKLTQPAK